VSAAIMALPQTPMRRHPVIGCERNSDTTRISRITRMGADMVMRVDAPDVCVSVGGRVVLVIRTAR